MLPWVVRDLLLASARVGSGGTAADCVWAAWVLSLRIGVLGTSPEWVRSDPYRSIIDWAQKFEPPSVAVQIEGLDGALGVRSESPIDVCDLVLRVVSRRLRPRAATDQADATRQAECAAMGQALVQAWTAGAFGSTVRLTRVRAGAPEGPSAKVDPLGLTENERDELLLWIGAGAAQSLRPWVRCEHVDARRAERILVLLEHTPIRSLYIDANNGERVVVVWSEVASRGQNPRAETKHATAAPGSDRECPRVPESVGPYQLQDVIGEGGMGRVYRALDRATGAAVALKLLRKPTSGSAGTSTRRFDREAQVLRDCEHPCLVRMLDSGTHDGMRWIATELIEGVTLEQLTGRVRSEATLRHAIQSLPGSQRAGGDPSSGPTALAPAGRPWEEIADLLANVADALHYLHRRGLVHRDVSPANVMVRANTYRPILIDLGLAFDGAEVERFTKSGAEPIGTLRYSPPERLLRGRIHEAPVGDIYSLGAVGFELVAGRALFDQREHDALCLAIATQESPWAHRVRPAVPIALSAVLRRAVARNPNARYSTAAEFAADLRRFARGEPVKASKSRPWTRLKERVSSVPHLGVFATLVLGTGGVVWVAGTWSGTTTAKAEMLNRFQQELKGLGDGDLQDVERERLEELVRRVLELPPSAGPRPPSFDRARDQAGETTRGTGATRGSGNADSEVMAQVLGLDRLVRDGASDEVVVGALESLAAMGPKRLLPATLDIDSVLEAFAQQPGWSEQRAGALERTWLALATANAEAHPGSWRVVQLYERCAWAAQGSGNLDRAAEHLSAAWTISAAFSPRNIESRRPGLALARLWRESGALDAANALLRPIQEAWRDVYPEGHPARMELEAELLLVALASPSGRKDGTENKALELFRSCLGLESATTMWRVELGLSLAQLAMKGGDVSAARSTLEAVLELAEAREFLPPEFLLQFSTSTESP